MRWKVETVAMLSALIAAPSALAADPSGLTVWKGDGSAGQVMVNQRPWKFDHLAELHFANGRSAFSTAGGPVTYVFSGSLPPKHVSKFEFHVDTVDVEQAGQRKTYQADGGCELKILPGRVLKDFGCGVMADRDLHFSVGFVADKTPPNFKSFDAPQRQPRIVHRSGQTGG